MPLALTPADVLLIIDMQRDFLPPLDGIGGALAVPGGDALLPGINVLAAAFPHVLLTQDWHPRHHISFASTHNKQPFTGTIEAPYGTQLLWPVHCLQGSPGAELHPGLDIPHAELILRKGFRPGIDSYSAFTENDGHTPTGLTGYLHERQLNRLFFCGVAYDYCVGFSAIAAAKLGFQAFVIEDLSRGIAPASIDATNATFAALNIHRIQASEIKP